MIYRGTTEISNIYKGTTEIQEIYKGNIEVYSAIKLTHLGTGTSFNLSSYNHFELLTADDFYVKTDNGVSSEYSDNYSIWGVGVSCSLTKSYNASTGVLSIYNNAYASGYNANNQTSACDVYLIHKKVKGANATRVSNVIDLGTGTSFNVANYYSDYTNLTNNNFYYTTYTGASGTAYTSGEYYYAKAKANNNAVTKSYNASTGVLTFYKRLTTDSVNGGGFNGNYSLRAWLVV